MLESLKTIYKFFEMYKLKFIYCIFFCGIFGTALVYYLGHAGKFYNDFFWVTILLSSTSTFLILTEKNVSNRTKLIFLFLYGIAIYLPSFLWSPNFFHTGDEIGQSRISELISEYGNTYFKYNFILPTDIVKNYPGLPIVAVFLSKISGIQIFYVSKFAIALAHSFLLIFIYIFFKYISTERIATLGAIIYTTNINYTFVDSMFAYESLGLLLMIMIIFATIRFEYSTKWDSTKWGIIVVIFIGALTMIHHFSSYMMTSFLIILLIIKLLEKDNTIRLKKVILLSIAMILSYVMYIAFITMTYFGNQVGSTLTEILNVISKGWDINSKYALDTLPVPQYEYFISKYVYIPIILFLSLLGTYVIYKRRFKCPNIYIRKNMIVIKALTVFALLTFLIPLVLIKGLPDMGRILTFGYIGVSFIVAIAMQYLFNASNKIKIPILIIFLLLVTGSISIGDKSSIRQPSLLIGMTASGESTLTTDLFYASDWFNAKTTAGQFIYGDNSVSTTFNEHGLSVESGIDAYNMFYSTSNNKSITGGNYVKSKVVLDRRILNLKPQYGFYFGTTLLPPGITPLPKESPNKFNESNIFSETYDNGNINIYNIY